MSSFWKAGRASSTWLTIITPLSMIDRSHTWSVGTASPTQNCWPGMPTSQAPTPTCKVSTDSPTISIHACCTSISPNLIPPSSNLSSSRIYITPMISPTLSSLSSPSKTQKRVWLLARILPKIRRINIKFYWLTWLRKTKSKILSTNQCANKIIFHFIKNKRNRKKHNKSK